MKTTSTEQIVLQDKTARKREELSRLFILSSGFFLFVTGAAKIVSALGKSPVLGKPDPILGVSFNHLLLAVGLIELAVSVICLTLSDKRLALGLLALLSVNFLSYRVGLWAIHWKGYCPCLGSLAQAIHLSRQQANLISLVILGYLASGSFPFLVEHWFRSKRKLICARRTSLTLSDSSGNRLEESRIPNKTA